MSTWNRQTLPPNGTAVSNARGVMAAGCSCGRFRGDVGSSVQGFWGLLCGAVSVLDARMQLVKRKAALNAYRTRD